MLDETGARGDIVFFQRLDDLVKREAVRYQLLWVGLNVKLLFVTPDHVHAGDSLHADQLRYDNPLH